MFREFTCRLEYRVWSEPRIKTLDYIHGILHGKCIYTRRMRIRRFIYFSDVLFGKFSTVK